MPADQQQDNATVRSELLREYHISCETSRRRVFETPFSTSHPDAWLAKHRQSFHQWLAASSPQYESYTAEGDHTEQASTMVGVLDEDPRSPPSYEDLTELIVRHMANQPRREQEEHQKTGRVPPSARPLQPEMLARPLQSLKFEHRRLEQRTLPEEEVLETTKEDRTSALSRRRDTSGVTSWGMSGVTIG